MRNIPSVGEKLLDRYELEELISSNEETAVFRAIDGRLGVACACKLLLVDEPKSDLDDDRIAMFLAAARNQAKLNHPIIVHLTNIESKRGKTFSVMEWLCGLTLAQHISEVSETLTPKEITEIFISVIDAVAVAHASNVIHKQINPSNLFLNQEGTRLSPRVLNFGGHRLTENLDPLAQLPFLAPEQFEDFHNATEQTDVFSICATMFYAFAHRPHLKFNSIEAYKKYYNSSHTTYFPHEIPNDFVPMLKKGLSDDPQNRHKNAQELLNDLKSIGSAYTISANLTIEAPKSYVSGQFKPVSTDLKRPLDFGASQLPGAFGASQLPGAFGASQLPGAFGASQLPGAMGIDPFSAFKATTTSSLILPPPSVPATLEKEYNLVETLYHTADKTVLRVKRCHAAKPTTFILKTLHHPTQLQQQAFFKAADDTLLLSMITPRVQAPISTYPVASSILTDDIERQSLAEVIEANGPIDQFYTLEVAIFLAQAMVCMHEAGVINGNIKPSNIFFENRDGISTPVFYDVGQRLYISRVQELTLEQVPFIAPELEYNLQRANAQSDIFAFGMLLNTMLYGGVPYKSKTMSSLVREIAARTAAPSLIDLIPGLDTDFVHIIDWCTAYNPAARYQSFSDILRDLYIVHPKLEAAASQYSDDPN